MGALEEKELNKRILAQARTAALSEAVRLATEISEEAPLPVIRAALKAVSDPQGPSELLENKMYERVVATEDRNEAQGVR